jgi:FkbM family methyltransferase
MKDYSQHGEGMFIWNYIKNNDITIPNVFFEIGGLDGITNSNSRMFFEMGWKGVLVEPNPHSFIKLIKNTSNFNGVYKFNVAISNNFNISNFNIVTKQNFQGHSSLSEGGKHKVITVPIEFIAKQTYKEIGIMSIDAEGYDTIIVKNLIESNLRPKILMVENMTKDDRLTHVKDQKNILETEYEFIKQISVNGIWKLKTL